jgi:hypothetical protein
MEWKSAHGLLAPVRETPQAALVGALEESDVAASDTGHPPTWNLKFTFWITLPTAPVYC